MLEKLPPRERQIVDVLYVTPNRTVAEICQSLPVELTQSAVRAMLTRLEAKGWVKRCQSDRGFIYSPAVARAAAKQSALKQLVRVFFDGSPVGAASALLGMSSALEDKDLDELERLVAKARKEKRQ